MAILSLILGICVLIGFSSCAHYEQHRIESSHIEKEIIFLFIEKDWQNQDFSKLVLHFEFYRIVDGVRVVTQEPIEQKWQFLDSGNLLTLKSPTGFKGSKFVDLVVYSEEGDVIKKVIFDL